MSFSAPGDAQLSSNLGRGGTDLLELQVLGVLKGLALSVDIQLVDDDRHFDGSRILVLALLLGLSFVALFVVREEDAVDEDCSMSVAGSLCH